MISLIQLLNEKESIKVTDKFIKEQLKLLKKELRKYPGIDELNLDYFDKTITIDYIYVEIEYRGKGIAGNVIKKILEFADKYQLDVDLMASPVEGYPLENLIKYYERFGFRYINDGYDTMIRKYKKQKSTDN